jgi:hypothetical protein
MFVTCKCVNVWRMQVGRYAYITCAGICLYMYIQTCKHIHTYIHTCMVHAHKHVKIHINKSAGLMATRHIKCRSAYAVPRVVCMKLCHGMILDRFWVQLSDGLSIRLVQSAQGDLLLVARALGPFARDVSLTNPRKMISLAYTHSHIHTYTHTYMCYLRADGDDRRNQLLEGHVAAIPLPPATASPYLAGHS